MCVLVLPLLGGAGHAHADTRAVEAEKVTAVMVSARDVNRISCLGPVQDVFYSTEKNAEVTPEGTNVFVKFKKRQQGEVVEVATEPVDVHVVCGDKVYTMILHPRDMDSTTIHLAGGDTDRAQAVLREWGALPIEDRVKRLTLAAYSGELPASFQRTSLAGDERRQQRIFGNLGIQAVSRITAPGLGLAAVEFELIALTPPLTLDERDFLNTQISPDIVAITLDPLVLTPAVNKGRLIVIERSVSDGR